MINQKFLKKILISSSPENPNFVHIMHSGKKKGDSLLYMLPSFKYCTVRCCSRKLKYANDGNSVGFLLVVALRELAIKLVIDNSFLYVLEPSVSCLLFSSALSSCYTVYFIKIKSIAFVCWGSYAYHSLCIELRDIQAELLLPPFPIWVPEIEFDFKKDLKSYHLNLALCRSHLYCLHGSLRT